MTEAASGGDPQDEAPGESEEGFWAAAGGEFDDKTAEEHASKIFAVWELGDFREAIGPAAGVGEDGGAEWTAEAATAAYEESQQAQARADRSCAPPGGEPGPAQDTLDAPVGGAQAAALAEEIPETAERPVAVAPERQAPVALRAPVARPVTDPEVVQLPQSRSNRLFLLAGAAVLSVALGGTIFAFWGGDDAPSTPASATPPAMNAAAEVEPAAALTSEPAIPSGVDVEGPMRAAAAAEPAVEEAPAAVAAAEEEVAPAAELAAARPVPPAPVVQEPAAPTTAHITVRTVPAVAALRIDGATVGNPYRADLEIGSRHRITATAEGYRSAQDSVRVREDREIVLTLSERPPERPRVATSVGHSGGRTPGSTTGTGRRGGQQAGRRQGRRGSGFVTANPYD